MTISVETVAWGDSSFGRLVRHHRDRLGLTQRQLADFSTVSVRAIRDIEQGRAKRPRNDTVRLIADGLRLNTRARETLVRAAKAFSPLWDIAERFASEPIAPPTVPNRLHGRQHEARVLHDELFDAGSRVVNLVGLSGMGKTRFAIDVAQELHASGLSILWHAFPGVAPAEYRRPLMPDGLPALLGVCASDLFGQDPLTSAGWLHGDIGVSQTPESQTHHEGHGISGLAGIIAAQPALLVLDGVEPQLRARPELFAQLLQDCPGLRILITSTGPIGLSGERCITLPPLAVPESGELDSVTAQRSPAMRLFIEEAQRACPGFAPDPGDLAAIVEICRRLDGVPGALRAAASWLVVFDLNVLRQCIIGPPDALLAHLAGAEGGFRICDALERRLSQLAEADAAVLAAMCVSDADLAVGDLADMTGCSLPDCGRAVRDLLLAGLIQAASGGDGDAARRTRFRALNLVRAVYSAAHSPDLLGRHPGIREL